MTDRVLYMINNLIKIISYFLLNYKTKGKYMCGVITLRINNLSLVGAFIN